LQIFHWILYWIFLLCSQYFLNNKWSFILHLLPRRPKSLLLVVHPVLTVLWGTHIATRIRKCQRNALNDITQYFAQHSRHVLCHIRTKVNLEYYSSHEIRVQHSTLYTTSNNGKGKESGKPWRIIKVVVGEDANARNGLSRSSAAVRIITRARTRSCQRIKVWFKKSRGKECAFFESVKVRKRERGGERACCWCHVSYTKGIKTIPSNHAASQCRNSLCVIWNVLHITKYSLRSKF